VTFTQASPFAVRRSRAAILKRAEGFTLVEVLIAIGLFVTMAIGVAQLMATAIETTRAAREHTSAVVLAASKMDQLCATALAELSPSPVGTLAVSSPPYVDYLNEAGSVIGSGAGPPGDAVFIRRWTIAPLPSDPTRTLVLSVLVTTVRLERLRGATPWEQRTGVEALLISVRTRREP
jgi:type II secretory pathway pseudopilin PulG